MRFEVDLRDCEVTGAIPKELDGALYRMHMDWLYPPLRADDTALAADGYISMFRLRNGRVDYKGRYVQTLRYLKQMEAGRQLYGYHRNPYTDDPSVRDIANPNKRTTANTTPVVLGGKLFATKEDSLPYEIDPNTLATRAQTNFDGAWQSQTFTAHPKVDPLTGETFAYGYEATGLCSRDVFVCRFDRNGKITRQWRFEAPHTSVLHDMWLTQTHLIIPGSGLVTDIEWLKAGGMHWAWDSSKPSYHVVIPREGGSEDIRCFFGPERSIVHTANAYTEGNRIVLEGPASDTNPWPWFRNLDGKPFTPAVNTFRRFTLDLDSKRANVVEETLDERPITSFTRIDERHLSLPYRCYFVQYKDQAVDSKRLGRTDGNTIGRFDVRGGEPKTFFPGQDRAVHEPVFIARGAKSPEGEGFLLSAGDNLENGTTELYVIDATTMEELARVLLPFRSSPQVHGTWATPADLPLN